VQTQLERLEVEPFMRRVRTLSATTTRRPDHDLAIENTSLGKLREKRLVQVGEVAVEGTQLAALDEDVILFHAENDGAKPIPLGLEQIFARLRNRLGELGQHRLDGWFDWGHLVCSLHRPRNMLSLLNKAFRDFRDDECPTLAAALAYYTVFALPPLLILLIMVAGAVWDPADVQRSLETQFSGLVGREAAGAIHEMIRQGDRAGDRGVVATILGTVALLFGATGAFIQLQSALNRAWEVKPDPKRGGIKNFLGKRLLSLGMVLGIAFLLVVSLAMSAAVSALGNSLTFMPEPALHAVNLGLSLVIFTLLFAAMFKILPDAEIEWRDVWVGAAVTTALLVLGKFLIGLYLGRSEPGSAFGAASALAVILIWIYYAGMILLFGAEFTQAWAKKRGAEIRPEKGAVSLQSSRPRPSASDRDA
jgi:membrane protein